VPRSLGTANLPIGAFHRQYGFEPDTVAAAIRTVVPASQTGGRPARARPVTANPAGITALHSGRYMPSMARDSRKSRCRLGQRTLVSRIAVNTNASWQEVWVLSGRRALLSPGCHRTTGFAEFLQRRREIAFVINADTCGLKGGVLLGTPLLPVRKQIPKQNATVSARSLEGHPVFVKQLDHRRTADT
jgi:hypothetical protein